MVIESEERDRLGMHVAARIVAASVIANVTHDRIMAVLPDEYPVHDLATHKGCITATHTAALEQHGPCSVHRRRFVNVRRVEGESVARVTVGVGHNDSDGSEGEPLATRPARPMENAR